MENIVMIFVIEYLEMNWILVSNNSNAVKQINQINASNIYGTLKD